MPLILAPNSKVNIFRIKPHKVMMHTAAESATKNSLILKTPNPYHHILQNGSFMDFIVNQ